MIPIEQITEELRLAGEDWADKEAAADLLADTLKILHASLCIKSQLSSIAAKEKSASTRDEYLEHVKKANEARRIANKAKVKWITCQAKVEMLRTNESTARAERKSY